MQLLHQCEYNPHWHTAYDTYIFIKQFQKTLPPYSGVEKKSKNGEIDRVLYIQTNR